MLTNSGNRNPERNIIHPRNPQAAEIGNNPVTLCRSGFWKLRTRHRHRRCRRPRSLGRVITEIKFTWSGESSFASGFSWLCTNFQIKQSLIPFEICRRKQMLVGNSVTIDPSWESSRRRVGDPLPRSLESKWVAYFYNPAEESKHETRFWMNWTGKRPTYFSLNSSAVQM